jgi:hypothetical protein
MSERLVEQILLYNFTLRALIFNYTCFISYSFLIRELFSQEYFPVQLPNNKLDEFISWRQIAWDFHRKVRVVIVQFLR